MKIRIITLAWAAFFVFLGTLASFSASTMTNDDVVKLVKAGLSEPVILAAIDECDPRFDVTPDGLVKLKTAGVTDGVIQRMIAKKPGPSAAPAPVLKGGDCRLSAPETLQPVLDGTRQVNLGFREPEFDEEVTAGSTLASFFTLGIAPEKGYISARISGPKATSRIESRTPVFLDLGIIQGQSLEDAFVLVTLETKGDNRVLVTGESTSSLIAGYKGTTRFLEGVIVNLKVEKVQSACKYHGETMDLYRAVPASPLPPGEYGFIFGDNLYDFGIDPDTSAPPEAKTSPRAESGPRDSK